ncbi:methylamine utilization protein MauJ [Ancylobacter sp. 6x-1]|uniref:Methylamine utilization protein MauJ n=1 Tax=Ancylobacter crimeensis TaxID=2579147 RepID=A0ABT0DD79_9HYPH|nr:methylamine utilization protein MauJ [Ancylobacter crimeensis]MCK0197913.1 methylamine utilization protein MauJ [Ancylobacter crimeensis]
MWIPYDLLGALKSETDAETIRRSKADRSARDVLVGFFVRNPVTQSWDVDVRMPCLDRVLPGVMHGMAYEISFHGGEAGKLGEIIYRVQASDPMAALSAALQDVGNRLARWTLELGRGMAVAGWRMADPAHGARWRCTPFRPSALDIDLDAVGDMPDDMKPAIRLYQRARNAADPSWRLLNASSLLRLWRDGAAPFTASGGRGQRLVTFEMLVHSGALAYAPDLRDRPLAGFVDELVGLQAKILSDLAAGTAREDAADWRLVAMAGLADLAARDVLLAELAMRRASALALAC